MSLPAKKTSAPRIDADMLGRFLAVAQDARIIPGVYHHCDEWCTYCAATSRCLEFRCTAEWQKHHGRPADAPLASVDEAVVFTRTIAAVEGTPTEEIDLLLAHPNGGSGLETTDPLASLVLKYAVGAAVLVASFGEEQSPPASEGGAPTPEDVVMWYHARLYFGIVRALIAKERHAAGSGGRIEDANGSAKLALVSIARSRDALRSLRAQRARCDIDSLIAALDEVERMVDDRFPDARAFLRVGLDVPVA